MLAGLTSDAEQGHDQAAQGQRQGEEEAATEDGASDGPHGAPESCASLCEPDRVWSFAHLIKGSSVALSPLLQTNYSTNRSSQLQCCGHVQTLQLYSSTVR